jgi:NhaP-type Na+/H+ or K+/H+ antiporter
MADGIDVLLALWKDQREADRQIEGQRATLTNIVIIVVAAGLGFIAKSGLQTPMLVVTLSMVVLGLYGVVACLKFHERSAFHIGQARGLRRQIAKQLPDLNIEAGLRSTSRDQRARFPRLRKVRLYMVWVALHGAIAVAGAALSAWIIWS